MTDSTLQEQVINEGKKHLPRCVKVGDRYSISKKIKGTHSIDVVMGIIQQNKVDAVLSFYNSKGITELNKALSGSVYFKLNGLPHRISNHESKLGFLGVEIRIRWNSDISKIKSL